jgi:hypothetical protein
MLLKKLIEILKTFDKAELKKFRRFITSDYFNTNESVSKLFKLIAKFYPDFAEESKMTSEVLFKGVYGSRKYDEKTFRYLLSTLYTLVEKFLGISVFENNEVELRKSVIDEMIERRLFNIAAKNLIAAESLLEKNSLISADYVYNKIDYLQLWHQLYFLSNKQDPLIEKRIEQGEFQMFGSVVELSHNFQIINMVAHTYNLELKDNLLFEYLRNTDFRKLFEYIETCEASGMEMDKIHYAFKIYFCFLITTLDINEEEYFEKMRVLVERYADLFSKPEQQNLYVMLGSCSQKKRKAINEEKYLRIFFEEIKKGVKRGLYTSYRAQYMDVSNFIMIFKTALQLNENDWAADFLRQYGERISPEFSEDMINYSFAELFFTKKQFERSLGSISKVKAKLFRLKVPVKILMLRLYYELSYIEEAFSLIDSFTHFLTDNKKIRTDEKNDHARFLVFYRELLKAKADGKAGGIGSKTMDELSSSSLLPHKAWLIEKAEEQLQE